MRCFAGAAEKVEAKNGEVEDAAGKEEYPSRHDTVHHPKKAYKGYFDL